MSETAPETVEPPETTDPEPETTEPETEPNGAEV